MPNYLVEVHNKTTGEKPYCDYWKVVNAENKKEAIIKGVKEISLQFGLDYKNMQGRNRSRSWNYIPEEIQHRLRYNKSIEEFIFPIWTGTLFLQKRRNTGNKRYR